MSCLVLGTAGKTCGGATLTVKNYCSLSPMFVHVMRTGQPGGTCVKGGATELPMILAPGATHTFTLAPIELGTDITASPSFPLRRTDQRMYVHVTTIMVNDGVTTANVQAASAVATMATVLGSSADWDTMRTSSFIVAGCETVPGTDVSVVVAPDSSAPVIGSSGGYTLTTNADPITGSSSTALSVSMHDIPPYVHREAPPCMLTPAQKEDMMRPMQTNVVILCLTLAILVIIMTLIGLWGWKKHHTLKHYKHAFHERGMV